MYVPPSAYCINAIELPIGIAFLKGGGALCRAPEKKRYQGQFRDNYPYFSIKTYFVTLP